LDSAIVKVCGVFVRFRRTSANTFIPQLMAPEDSSSAVVDTGGRWR
jgi:hypothetical protein